MTVGGQKRMLSIRLVAFSGGTPLERKERGPGPDAQDRLRQMNERAWYDLIQVTNIHCFANVQLDPDPIYDTTFLQSLLFR